MDCGWALWRWGGLMAKRFLHNCLIDWMIANALNCWKSNTQTISLSLMPLPPSGTNQDDRKTAKLQNSPHTHKMVWSYLQSFLQEPGSSLVTIKETNNTNHSPPTVPENGTVLSSDITFHEPELHMLTIKSTEQETQTFPPHGTAPVSLCHRPWTRK